MAHVVATAVLLLLGGARALPPLCFSTRNGAYDSARDMPATVAQESYVKVDTQKQTRCGMTADGWLDCWGENYVRLPDRITDFSMSTFVMCTAMVRGGVNCYTGFREFFAGPLTNVTLFEGIAISGLAAVHSVDNTMQVCALDGAGTVLCQSDLPAPSGLTGVAKIVGNNFFFCAMQAAPGNIDCWLHEANPSDGSYNMGAFREVPAVAGPVYDMDASGWGGLCVVNASRMVECYGGWPYDQGGLITDAVDNSQAPFAAVAMGTWAVCALRGQPQQVVCWGTAMQLPGDLSATLSSYEVTGMGLGGSAACLQTALITSTTTSSVTSATASTSSATTASTTSSSTGSSTSSVTRTSTSSSTATATGTSVTSTVTETTATWTSTSTTATSTSVTATVTTATATVTPTTATGTTTTATATTATGTATSVTATRTTTTATSTATTVTATATTATTATTAATATATATRTTRTTAMATTTQGKAARVAATTTMAAVVTTSVPATPATTTVCDSDICVELSAMEMDSGAAARGLRALVALGLLLQLR